MDSADRHLCCRGKAKCNMYLCGVVRASRPAVEACVSASLRTLTLRCCFVLCGIYRALLSMSLAWLSSQLSILTPAASDQIARMLAKKPMRGIPTRWTIAKLTANLLTMLEMQLGSSCWWHCVRATRASVLSLDKLPSAVTPLYTCRSPQPCLRWTHGLWSRHLEESLQCRCEGRNYCGRRACCGDRRACACCGGSRRHCAARSRKAINHRNCMCQFW